VLVVALLLALRFGPFEAGAKLGEGYVVTSVTARSDAIYVKVRVASGEVVTYGLAKSSHDPSVVHIDGARVFYVGEQSSAGAIERGAELIVDALQKAELTGDKLAAAIDENLASGDPRKLDPEVAASILKSLEGKWRVTVGTVKGSATRTRFLGDSVLREESCIPAALAAFSLIGFDRANSVFWALEIDPKTGSVTTSQGEWSAEEKSMEFRLAQDASGSVQTVVLRIVSPTMHMLEQFVTPKGEPAKLVKSATFER
jgi:hypothetical protein